MDMGKYFIMKKNEELIFEGEIYEGKPWNGKSFKKNAFTDYFKGEYLNGKKWKRTGSENDYDSDFEREFFEGKK